MKSHSQSHCSGQSFNAGRIGVKEGMLMLRVVKRNKRSRSMRRPCRRRISRTKKNVYPDQKNGQRVFFFFFCTEDCSCETSKCAVRPRSRMQTCQLEKPSTRYQQCQMSTWPSDKRSRRALAQARKAYGL